MVRIYARMNRDSQLNGAREDLLPTRRSLLGRLKNWDDQESWNDFFTTYWKLIFVSARKAGCTEEEAQDVVQDTLISVSKNIPDFKYDAKEGSFKGWLMQLTRWRIRDQLRKRLPPEVLENDAQPGDGTDLVERVPDPAGFLPDAEWEADWEKNLFDAAIERVKRKVDPRKYQIFDLYTFQEWPLDKVRKLLKVSSAKVYMTKHRVSNLIKKEMRILEKEVSRKLPSYRA